MEILPGIAGLDNHFGLMALVAYIATLLPTTCRVVFPSFKTNRIPRFLLKNRRTIGILAFFLALVHAYFVIRKRNFDFFSWDTYIASFEGTATFIIFTLLAITSNDWSVKRLKRNWKRLHNLTYLAMFLLMWHVANKMSGQWTVVTPFAAVGITTITILFGIRRWIEVQNEFRKRSNQAKGS